MKPSLLFDSWIIAVKEWREWCAVRGRLGWGALVALIVAWSIIAPHLLGQLEAGPLIVALLLAALPLTLSGVMITDSLAGERERQTLETLLASRLPDRAIILGKVIAVTAAGWALLLLGMLPGVLQHLVVRITGFEDFDLLAMAFGLIAVSAPCIVLIVIVGALISLFMPNARFALLMTIAFVGSFVLAASGLAIWWTTQSGSYVEQVVPSPGTLGLVLMASDAVLLILLLMSVHRDRLLAIG